MPSGENLQHIKYNVQSTGHVYSAILHLHGQSLTRPKEAVAKCTSDRQRLHNTTCSVSCLVIHLSQLWSPQDSHKPVHCNIGASSARVVWDVQEGTSNTSTCKAWPRTCEALEAVHGRYQAVALSSTFMLHDDYMCPSTMHHTERPN